MGFLYLGSGVVMHLFGQQYFATAPAVTKGTEWFWIIGILFTLLGATLTVVGLIVQKQSHVSSGDKSSTRPYWLEAKWLTGGAIWMIGNLICWIALGLAPQSILASVNCWNIVVSLAIAPWLLGEPVSKWLVGNAAVLAFGTGWVILCGPREYQQHTANLIVDALSKTQSICAFGMTAMFLLAMSIIAYKHWRVQISPPLSYIQFTMVSASFAWYATLMSKSTAKVLVASVQLSVPMYKQLAFWGFAAGFAICAVAQVHFLNLGLKYGDAVMVIPIYEALSMTGQITIAGVVFDEFANFGFGQHLWFWFGVAVVLVGILSIICEKRHSVAKSDATIKANEQTPLMH